MFVEDGYRFFNNEKEVLRESAGYGSDFPDLSVLSVLHRCGNTDRNGTIQTFFFII